MTTHPEHDEELLFMLYKLRPRLFDRDETPWQRVEAVKTTAAELIAWRDAHTAKAVEEAQLKTFEFCIANFRSKAYILDKYNVLKERKPMSEQSKVREILTAAQVCPDKEYDKLCGSCKSRIAEAEQALYDAMREVIKPKNAIDRSTKLNALFGKKEL